PKIQGTLSARITSPGQYKYAYLTKAGHYVVRFDFDFEQWPKGMESEAIPLAKPYAGGLQTGFHFPLIDGTEVAIAFRDGNPNKPYIAHALHNSRQEDLITTRDRWLSRNLIRTQSNNKLRMEDWKGEESIKLSTEYGGKTQLNLGYLVDRNKKKRGEGFELRTDAWGAIRGGKGLFLSADAQPKAGGQQLDMQEAKAQLDAALAQMQALAESARMAQAHAAEVEKQRQFLGQRLDKLQQAVLLATAPAGVAVTSGHDLQLAAQGQVTVTASGNADIGVLKKFTVAAGEAISLFARKLGIKLFAAKGKVEIQAQSDEMHLTALKDLKIISVDGKLILSAEKEVWLGAGGSYIRITPEGIENGTPGDILEKCAFWDKPGPASMSIPLPGLPGEKGFSAQFTVRDRSGAILPNYSYRLEAENGLAWHGRTDENGMTERIWTANPQNVILHQHDPHIADDDPFDDPHDC
ncbi:DUF2345 domain-containing protein, partial [Cupriavidus sp. 2MCAB6]|uniref:DUF2345 domain-containing protein n=1 Tax=Cupriavidus sp. 2MCAB6 TaxID=3232981 RepID=UPI003F909777